MSTLFAAAMYCVVEFAMMAHPAMRYPLWVTALCVALNLLVAQRLIRTLRSTRHSALGSLVSLRQHFLACALPKKRRAEPDDYKLEHMPELEPIEFEPLERRDPGRHGLLGLFLSWWLRLRMVLRPG